MMFTQSMRYLAGATIASYLLAAYAPAFAQSAAPAPQVKRQMLMTKELPDLGGKEALFYAIEYPPGISSPPHRHNGHVFLHVVEGELQVQVKGGELETLGPGKTYYESPGDVHIVSRNPSATSVTKAMVFIIHDKGAPLSVPEKE
jgi:quercetin dioxygenase-like cupin family protein